MGNINNLDLNINKLTWEIHTTIVAKLASIEQEFCSDCRNYFFLENYFNYIRVLSTFVWSIVLTFWEGEGVPVPPFSVDRV